MKKGFTLVELLGVIVLLAVIASLTIPSVSGIIKNNKEKAYAAQVDNIVNNAKAWSNDHSDDLSETLPTYITVSDLISQGYIEQDVIKDPRNNETMNGCVKITFAPDYNQFEFNYEEPCTR